MGKLECYRWKGATTRHCLLVNGWLSLELNIWEIRWGVHGTQWWFTCLVICQTQSMNCRNTGDLSASECLSSPCPILYNIRKIENNLLQYRTPSIHGKYEIDCKRETVCMEGGVITINIIERNLKLAVNLRWLVKSEAKKGTVMSRFHFMLKTTTVVKRNYSLIN